MTTGKKPFKYKKVAYLLLILLLPSFFYVILSSGEHKYKPLPFIGESHEVETPDSTYTVHHTIPPFSLTDQNGETFTQADMQGKICVVDFFFTRCPTICPKMSAHFLELQERFQDMDQIMFISHTVDPKNDTPEVLTEYAKKVHAIPGRWYFLTGEKADIYNLANKAYFAPASEDETAPGGFLHSELVFLVDKHGRLRGTFDEAGNIQPAFDGTSTTSMKQLTDAIDNLLLEDFVPKKKS